MLSTGLAEEKEVVATIAYLQEVNPMYLNKENLAVLQCTSMYPIPSQDANLSVMQRLKELTGCTVGYSDHTEGSEALAIAVAMGAEVLEFHFTDSREGKSFRDHKVSLTKDEVLALRDRIKVIHQLKGNAIKQPLPVEGDHITTFRRAVYPARAIPKGKVIAEKDLVVLRPNHGIDAREYDQLIGQTASVDLVAHQKLDWKYFNK